MKKLLLSLFSCLMAFSLVACSPSGQEEKEETPTVNISEADQELETDVVVVGGGGAGISAAITAAQNGANVVLIEKLGYLGGATMLSGGIIPATGTVQQQAAGISDSNEWFARDIMRPSNYSVRQDLVDTVVENSKETIEWLESLGCTFTLIDNALYYGQSNYRMHLSEEGGKGMTTKMIEYLDGLENVTVLTETKGIRLVTNETKEVIGVMAENKDGTLFISANNTILATSGYAANKEMVKEYIPEMEYAFPYVAPGATGEGIIWGQELGAKVANMKAYQGHAFYNEEIHGSVAQSMANNGGIFVNNTGVRFTNEYNGYSELAPHVLAQPDHYAYLVINQAIADGTTAFSTYQEKGIVLSGNTVEELANAMDVPTSALKDTFDRYEASIIKGEDEFNKTKLPASWDGPYYAIKITGDLRHTQGGLVTDVDAHVLREDGSVIQGLYAAGGVTEGFTSVGGAAYMSGDGLLQAIVFGQIAGANASKETRGNIQATVR